MKAGYSPASGKGGTAPSPCGGDQEDRDCKNRSIPAEGNKKDVEGPHEHLEVPWRCLQLPITFSVVRKFRDLGVYTFPVNSSSSNPLHPENCEHVREGKEETATLVFETNRPASRPCFLRYPCGPRLCILLGVYLLVSALTSSDCFQASEEETAS